MTLYCGATVMRDYGLQIGEGRMELIRPSQTFIPRQR